MRTEATLIERTIGSADKDGSLRAEVHAWSRLFSKKYIDRTSIGVMMMVYQRE